MEEPRTGRGEEEEGERERMEEEGERDGVEMEEEEERIGMEGEEGITTTFGAGFMGGDASFTYM